MADELPKVRIQISRSISGGILENIEVEASASTERKALSNFNAVLKQIQIVDQPVDSKSKLDYVH